jgi:hypothetical protein
MPASSVANSQLRPPLTYDLTSSRRVETRSTQDPDQALHTLLLFLVYAKVQVRLAIYREQTSEGPVEIQALNENNFLRYCAVTPLRDHASARW